jgi:hypothetical protein
LALPVDGQDDGVRRRIDVEADDVAQLVDEFRIGGELELTCGGAEVRGRAGVALFYLGSTTTRAA